MPAGVAAGFYEANRDASHAVSWTRKGEMPPMFCTEPVSPRHKSGVKIPLSETNIFRKMLANGAQEHTKPSLPMINTVKLWG